MNQHIAIDGPAGSGKSTIARIVAAKLGKIYVDTGAMYRGMAVYFLRQGLKPEDEGGICSACEHADVSIAYEDGQQQIILNGENITPYLRQEETGNMASASSVYPVVREKMGVLQKKLASEHAVVMDGRDIGTVVLPDAFLKVYMTADCHVRALRRCKELEEKGQPCDIQVIEEEIRQRDERDMTRKTAPLKQADDAVLLDTSAMSIQEVSERILQLYEDKIKNA